MVSVSTPPTDKVTDNHGVMPQSVDRRTGEETLSLRVLIAYEKELGVDREISRYLQMIDNKTEKT